MKICPACEEPLKDDAIACTHCGHQLAPIPATSDHGPAPTPNRLKFGCGVLIIATFVLVFWLFTARYGTP
jgi:hypothetical protein